MLSYGEDLFEILWLSVEDEDHRLGFQVLMDHATGRIRVIDKAGELLCDITAPYPTKGITRGVTIHKQIR